jgi:hypothetical protein
MLNGEHANENQMRIKIKNSGVNVKTTLETFLPLRCKNTPRYPSTNCKYTVLADIKFSIKDAKT